MLFEMLSQEEHETAVQQRRWLLEHVIPNMLDELKAQLEKSQQILTNQDKADSLPLTLQDTVKGFVTFNGSYITKAELQVKLSNQYQDHPIKAAINSDLPYFLEQAQQAINYLSLASNRLKSFVTPTHKQATIEFLEDMYQYVDRALHAFDYPSEASLFPYKVCHPKYFSPPLKQDIVIEFCIKDMCIACNIYALDYNFLKHGNSKSHVDDQRSFVTYKDKPVMILETVKTEAQSPMLTELKAAILSILKHCQTYKQMLIQIEV